MNQGTFGQTDNDIDEAVNLGQAALDRQAELDVETEAEAQTEEEEPVTVTFHLSREMFEHILEYKDYLSKSFSLSIEQCTILSLLDQILESAIKQGVRV